MWTQRKAKDYFEEEIIHGEKKNSIPKKTIQEFLERLALAETWLFKSLLSNDEEVKAAAINVKLFSKKQNSEAKIHFGDLYVIQNVKTRRISFKLYSPPENKFVWCVDASDSSGSSSYKLDGYVDLKCNTHILHLTDSVYTFKFPDKKERTLFIDNLNKFLYFEKLRVLITGSNRGLGLELVKQLIAYHDPPDRLIATCRNPESASELQALATRFNHLIVLALDVNNVSTFAAFAQKVRSILGENGLNLVIHNAGVMHRKANLEEITYDEYMNVLHTNTVGPIFLTKALLPLIKKASAMNSDKDMGIKRAAIVNMSSIMGSVSLTNRGYWGYSESKAALNQATRLLTANLISFKILVVSVHPGWVRTELGGHQANLTAEQSIASLLELLYNLSEFNNGTFLRLDGEEIPW